MKILVLSDDDYEFIVSYDPERERTANRAALVTVIEDIQAVIDEAPVLDLEDDA